MNVGEVLKHRICNLHAIAIPILSAKQWDLGKDIVKSSHIYSSQHRLCPGTALSSCPRMLRLTLS